jgi:hypothetical protein
MPLSRDPLSRWFDPAAVRLLERAYRNPGQWTGTYLSPPSVRARAAAGFLGIWDLAGRDKWGEVRWVRAYKRAVFYQHRLYGYSGDFRPGQPRASDHAGTSLEWQTGQRVLKAGWPSRKWAIRVRVHPAGTAATRAAEDKVPASKRWTDPVTGAPTELQSTIADRDWETV